MLDHPILARGIEPLQHNQHRLPGIRVKQILRLPQAFEVPLNLAFGLLVRHMLPSVRRIDLIQVHLGPRLDNERLAIGHLPRPVN